MNLANFTSDTLAYMSSQDMLIIAGIALLLFGGTKLPQLAKGLGQGIREFKNAVDHNGPDTTPPPVGPDPHATVETTTNPQAVAPKTEVSTASH